MLSRICRWTGCLHDPANAASVAAQVWTAAMAPRPGPVLLRVPIDVGGRPGIPIQVTPQLPSAVAAAQSGCQAAADLLAGASRPLLVLGNGARSAHAELRVLAERLQMPVMVTGHGKGVFPETHPLYVGIIGLGQHPSVLDQLSQPPDVTLVVGSRLGDLATNGWSLPLAGTRATIQIDRDPILLGRNAAVSHALIGDAAKTAAAIVRALPADVAPPPGSIQTRRTFAVRPSESVDAAIKPQYLLSELQRRLPAARWVADIGEHLAHALHTLTVDRPEQFTTMLGYGSMGSGVCGAIGIKLAHPEQVVLCVCGDGGFSSYMAELMSCVEHRIGVVFVVFNDGRWNMVEHGFEAVYGHTPVRLIDTVADLGEISRQMGARACKVASARDLDQLDLSLLVASDMPLVLDVRIDASESLTKETRSASLKHFHGGLDHEAQ